MAAGDAASESLGETIEAMIIHDRHSLAAMGL
jgi:hypothetical protein